MKKQKKPAYPVCFPPAESALITGALHVTVPMTERLTLSLREEYASSTSPYT